MDIGQMCPNVQLIICSIHIHKHFLPLSLSLCNCINVHIRFFCCYSPSVFYRYSFDHHLHYISIKLIVWLSSLAKTPKFDVACFCGRVDLPSFITSFNWLFPFFLSFFLLLVLVPPITAGGLWSCTNIIDFHLISLLIHIYIWWSQFSNVYWRIFSFSLCVCVCFRWKST